MFRSSLEKPLAAIADDVEVVPARIHLESVPTRRLWGLLNRKERWGLSWRGWLLVACSILLLCLLVVLSAQPFLALSQPISTETLVVEGWVPPITLKEAASEFNRRHYRRVLLVRPVADVPDKYESGRYVGDYMANTLMQYGVPQEALTTLFCVAAQQDRTYHSALAARLWMKQNGVTASSLDVATLGPHARRSRLLFQEAFQGEAKVGVIALADADYDPARWWRFSRGVREVIGELIAYVYAKVLFRAPARDTEPVKFV